VAHAGQEFVFQPVQFLQTDVGLLQRLCSLLRLDRGCLDLLEQAGPLDEDGQVTGQRGQQSLVVLGERVDLRALDVEYTDDPRPDDQGDAELRTRVACSRVVAGILLNVRHERWLPMLCYPAGDALAQLQAQAPDQIGGVTDARLQAQRAPP